MGAAASQFIAVRGMQVHLREEGPRDDPVPIVLLHGTGASLHTWDGWTRELPRERRAIRFDLPGFGLTGPSPDGNYTVESYVDTVLTLADTLGVQRFVLAGIVDATRFTASASSDAASNASRRRFIGVVPA